MLTLRCIMRRAGATIVWGDSGVTGQGVCAGRGELYMHMHMRMHMYTCGFPSPVSGPLGTSHDLTCGLSRGLSGEMLLVGLRGVAGRVTHTVSRSRQGTLWEKSLKAITLHTLTA